MQTAENKVEYTNTIVCESYNTTWYGNNSFLYSSQFMKHVFYTHFEGMAFASCVLSSRHTSQDDRIV